MGEIVRGLVCGKQRGGEFERCDLTEINPDGTILKNAKGLFR